MQKIFPSFILLFVLLSCQSNSGNQNHEETDSSNGNTIIVSELDSVARAGQSFILLDSSFDPQTFQESGSSADAALAATPVIPEQMDAYLPFLIYNNDSSLAIDPYSYNYILNEKGGKVKAEDAGPDSEIALIDIKAKTRKRLWFSGPSSRIIDVKWKNEEVIWLSGINEITPNTYQPFMLEIHTKNNMVRSFESSDTLHEIKRNLLKEGLQQKIQAAKTSPAF